jgi:hypothetical protein
VTATDWTLLPTYDAKALLDELCLTRSDESALHAEIAFLKTQEASTRARVFSQNLQSSVAQREREADAAALPHKTSLFDAEAKLASLELKDSLIRILLTWLED